MCFGIQNPSKKKLSKAYLDYLVEIFKSNAQLPIVEFGYGHKFHDLKYIEVRFILFFYMIFEFIPYMRAKSQKFVNNRQLNVM